MNFGAYDRLNAGLPVGGVELNRAEQIVYVGDG